ncbi:DUF3810 domain-containing protein [Butyrivibrio sp. INlla14]|uniref:DUF3810 domain-containing protein n=1 Tax=Butyrivibrio sp. INlla14 TaxID=1520808 RepID=UPI0008774477|nr:DUF3810 domain-containing protein [Butyrivibrio sp. INlla14]SCX92110.1 Protein of unknown function [Butyrivibrio sp. INlla14]
MKKGKTAYSLPILIIIGLCIIFNVAAWKSAVFSDFYVTNIFPVITGLYGRVTNLVSFSVGEVLLVAVVLYIAFLLVFVLVHTIILTVARFSGENSRKDTLAGRILNKISDILYRVTPVLLTITIVIMSLNCFVLYHCSRIGIRVQASEDDYNIVELTQLRDYVVRKCNELSKKVPHDENGNVLYEGNMAETAKEAMLGLSGEYPRLGGYYVTPKALYFSDFMCQQYMQGYYFPFSMEANYNDTMNMMHKPFTMCHELAHTHGYIYEDEANFFGFLACINSDDIVFQYSGYLGVLNYINNDFYDAVGEKEYKKHVKISDRVKYDNQFLSPEGWQEVEKKAVIKTETVKKAADTFVDTNLKVNGVSAGKASYRYVVGLIMDYYYNNSVLARVS